MFKKIASIAIKGSLSWRIPPLEGCIKLQLEYYRRCGELMKPDNYLAKVASESAGDISNLWSHNISS